MFPNTAKSTKFSVTLSNVPLFTKDPTDTEKSEQGDMRLYDHYFRSLSSPEKVNTDIPSYYGNGQHINQDPSGNRELYTFSIEYAVDEDWINYSTLVRWWKWVKAGKVSPAMLYKNFNINEVNIHFMDNQKRVKYTERLRTVALQSLSGITTGSDDDSELTFTASFIAQHFDFITWKDFEQNIECINTMKELEFAN